jgi:hypothetical protein
LNLAPNSNYSNLLYFEQVRPLVETRADLGRGNFQYSGTVRLVYWLNFDKMGVTREKREYFGGRIAAQLISALGKSWNISEPEVMQITYDNFSIIPPSREIFGKYDYPQEIDALMLEPFDFGAVDFQVTIGFSKACLNNELVGEPIECISEWLNS